MSADPDYDSLLFVDSATSLQPVANTNSSQAGLTPIAVAVEEPVHKAAEIIAALCEAREQAQALENLHLELTFRGPRERGSSSRQPKVQKRVAVSFLPRLRFNRRNSRSLVVLQLSEVGAQGKPPLTLRVDVVPTARNKQDPRIVSIGLAMSYSRSASGTWDDDPPLLTRTPVNAQFEGRTASLMDTSGADEERLLLSSVQSLGPMLAELQHTWFTARARNELPKSVEAKVDSGVADYWVSSSGDESWTTWEPTLSSGSPEAREEWGKFLASLIAWRAIAALYAGDDEDRQELRGRAGFPEPEEFFPKRPVDLSPSEVRNHLNARKLRVPWHVIEAACTSLNAGKHVIFTGPPGCGKTELAVELALLATRREREGLLVTASPAWSSAELVGRYFPRPASYGLDFAPGFFLRAIRERRWLIIDEFNRAPIDSCLGELFTVLSGQLVELPFAEHAVGSEPARVRILPALRDGAARGHDDEEGRTFSDYVVPPEFRIIGTMNDADRSELSRLSFALLRRFDIIRVDAPDANDMVQVIGDTMLDAAKKADLVERGYVFKGARHRAAAQFENLKDTFAQVFVGDGVASQRRPSVGGLVADRVVGVATCRDVIAFVAEGLRAPSTGMNDERSRRCAFKKDAETEGRFHPRNLARSYLAMALVLKVFPQLEALDAEKRFETIKRLTKVFEGDTFLRVEPLAEGNEADCSFEIVSVEAGDAADADGDQVLSIAEYLVDEIRRQLRGTGEDERYADLLVTRSLSEAGARE